MLKQLLLSFYFASQSIFNRLESNEPEWLALDDLIVPGDLVVDIGANIGRYTLRMSELVGKDGLVLALEPNRRMFFVLNFIINARKRHNVCLYNCCASTKSGAIFNFHRSDFKPPRAIFGTETQSVTRPITDNNASIERVIAVSIDDLVGLSNIALIKIDVEGAELDVLLGAEKTLIRCKPTIIVEVNSDASHVNAFLHRLGYMIKNESPYSRNRIYSH